MPATMSATPHSSRPAPIPSSSLLIRPLLAEDITFAYELLDDSYPLSKIARGILELTLDHPLHVGLIASVQVKSKRSALNYNYDHQFKPVGVAVARITEDLKYALLGRVDIQAIAVAPPYRRRGIGIRLLRRCVQRSVTYPIRGLVSEYNLAGQFFLSACGLRADVAMTEKAKDAVIGDVLCFGATNSDAVERVVSRHVRKYDVGNSTTAGDANCSGR